MSGASQSPDDAPDLYAPSWERIADYRPYLFKVLWKRHCRLIHRPDVVDDLVQETLLRAGRDRASFRGTTEGELRGWLRGILQHVVGGLSRQQKSHPDPSSLPETLAATAREPPEEALHTEENALFEKTVAGLSVDERYLIEAKFSGIPDAEQAAHLGIAIEALRQRRSRLFHRLQDDAIDGGEVNDIIGVLGRFTHPQPKPCAQKWHLAWHLAYNYMRTWGLES
jgi:RNA polymerase sigma factor (sigma-70 family)